MAVQKAFKGVHQILHNSVQYRGIVSQNFITGTQQTALQGGGGLDPSNMITTKVDSSYTFGSTDLKLLLDVCGLLPIAITGTASDTLKFYCRELTDGGTLLGSTTDLIGTINKATMYLKSITANLDGPAIAEYEVIPTFDGTNTPIVYTQGTALALTRDAIAWGLGTVKINSVDIPIQSFTYEPGFTVEKMGAGSGLVYNTECFTTSRNPKITLGLKNILHILPAGLSPAIGASAPGTAVIFLRKHTMGGGFVANATAEHISFSFANSTITTQGSGGSGQSIADFNLVVTPVYDTSTAMTVMNTAVAIT